jgi:Winged helix DNA-binding domain
MTNPEIVRQRLVNQQLMETHFKSAGDLVGWMGAIQAQEFAMARWAIGLRVPGLSDSAIEQSFNKGEILRTHLLRPTWHFVAPADIRWIAALTAPQVNAISAYMYRQVELDGKIFRRSNRTLIKALTGGHYLTRKQLQVELQRAKIPAEGQRLAYLMMRAELDGVVCSGPRLGNQFTYALLEERVPPVAAINRSDALSRLSDRYFRSRGPATIHDFAKWSGLSIRDARSGSESLSSDFVRETHAGQKYIFTVAVSGKKTLPLSTFLMPEYDEYGMSYKDRRALSSPTYSRTENENEGTSRNYCLVIDGLITGSWRRDEKLKIAIVKNTFLKNLGARQQRAVKIAIKRYDRFVTSSN